MKGPALVDLTAEVFGLEAKTVFNIARALREAGYITQGAGGRGAPHMTYRDAARLSIALLTGAPMRHVVERFEYYRKLQVDPEAQGWRLQEVLGLPDGHTLEDAVTGMFSLWDDESTLEPFRWDMPEGPFGRMEPPMLIRLQEVSQNCTLHFSDESVVYDDVSHWARLHDLNSEFHRLLEFGELEAAEKIQAEISNPTEVRHGQFRGMRVTREISTPEIQRIALEVGGRGDG